MRVLLGIAVAACALAAAANVHDARRGSHVVIHGGDAYPHGNGTVDVMAASYRRKAGWQGPAAIVIAVAGVGAGLAIALPALKR
jgi:hypothetical protein